MFPRVSAQLSCYTLPSNSAVPGSNPRVGLLLLLHGICTRLLAIILARILDQDMRESNARATRGHRRDRWSTACAAPSMRTIRPHNKATWRRWWGEVCRGGLFCMNRHRLTGNFTEEVFAKQREPCRFSAVWPRRNGGGGGGRILVV